MGVAEGGEEEGVVTHKDIVAELDDLLRWFDEPPEVLATLRRARDVIVVMRQQLGVGFQTKEVAMKRSFEGGGYE